MASTAPVHPPETLPQTQAAYDQCMASLDAAHRQLNTLTKAKPPVDWTAYQAAVDACGAIGDAAKVALGVFEAAILDTPAVTDLLQKLTADTASMKSKTAALTSVATTLAALSSVATDAEGILTTISRYKSKS